MSKLPTQNKAILRHVDAMFRFLDNGNNQAVLKEYEKIDSKLQQLKNEEIITAHIIIKAIALYRLRKGNEAIQLIKSVQDIHEQLENLKKNTTKPSDNLQITKNPENERRNSTDSKNSDSFEKPKQAKKKDRRNRNKKNNQKSSQNSDPSNQSQGPIIHRHGFPHIPKLYSDRQAIDALSFFYSNELGDYDLLMSHWEKANAHFPDNMH